MEIESNTKKRNKIKQKKLKKIKGKALKNNKRTLSESVMIGRTVVSLPATRTKKNTKIKKYFFLKFFSFLPKKKLRLVLCTILSYFKANKSINTNMQTQWIRPEKARQEGSSKRQERGK